MHDIVHDFAQIMSKNECFTINSDKDLGSNYNYAHHLQLEIPTEAQFPKSIYSVKNLRTLIFLLYQSHYDLSNLFQHFRYLRALTLNCGNTLLKEPLNAVGNFIHLRNLSLVK